MINKYKLNKIARHFQCAIRNNVIEHYQWAYQYIQARHYNNEQKRAKALATIDQCLTPGKYRNNHRMFQSFRELYGDKFQWMKHVLNFRVPSVSFLASDFRAIEQEFDSVSYSEKDRVIRATIGPFEVEGVQFGRFQIEFSTIVFGKVFEDYRPRVIALEPNYSNGNRDYPHPHVNGRSICVGQGEAALSKAVAEARIFDCFTIIHSILSTYGNDPYMPIEAWTGQRCPDCDRFYDPDESGSFCESCDTNYCGSCVKTCCDSNNTYCCYGCRRANGYECYRCGHNGCSSCTFVCKGCGSRYCSDDLKRHGCVQENLF